MHLFNSIILRSYFLHMKIVNSSLILFFPLSYCFSPHLSSLYLCSYSFAGVPLFSAVNLMALNEDICQRGEKNLKI